MESGASLLKLGAVGVGPLTMIVVVEKADSDKETGVATMLLDIGCKLDEDTAELDAEGCICEVGCTPRVMLHL